MRPHHSKRSLMKLFKYENGNLFWKVKLGSRTKVGELAGWKEKRYRSVKIDGYTYKVHRIIWVMHNGQVPSGMVIDHIDGNGFNNNIQNLRLASGSSNQCNQVNRKSTSKSGVRGVYLSGEKFIAKMTQRGEDVYLGTFENKKDAESAYKKAHKKYIQELKAELDSLKASVG